MAVPFKLFLAITRCYEKAPSWVTFGHFKLSLYIHFSFTLSSFSESVCSRFNRFPPQASLSNYNGIIVSTQITFKITAEFSCLSRFFWSCIYIHMYTNFSVRVLQCCLNKQNSRSSLRGRSPLERWEVGVLLMNLPSGNIFLQQC